MFLTVDPMAINFYDCVYSLIIFIRKLSLIDLIHFNFCTQFITHLLIMQYDLWNFIIVIIISLNKTVTMANHSIRSACKANFPKQMTRMLLETLSQNRRSLYTFNCTYLKGLQYMFLLTESILVNDQDFSLITNKLSHIRP